MSAPFRCGHEGTGGVILGLVLVLPETSIGMPGEDEGVG